jgi:serine O-acetyltransferase
MISATLPDWSREEPRRFWDPSRKLLRSIRRYQGCINNGISGLIISKYWVIIHQFWSIITGAEIHLNCQIGGGLLLPHPNGIVIHPSAIIGVNCLIFQQVTIGGGDKPPVIHGHVDIGAGAKVLGDIIIEDHVRIGANSVVTKNVNIGSTVVGVPAKPI